MFININEKKFYDAIKSIFVWEDIEWKWWYVNLLKIKKRYYELVLDEFKKEIDNDELIKNNPKFKEELFDQLYTFFEKYFSEIWNVYYTRTAPWQKIYEQIYTDDKDKEWKVIYKFKVKYSQHWERTKIDEISKKLNIRYVWNILIFNF